MSKSSEFASYVDIVLKFFEIIAIISAGIWAFVQYTAFQKEQADLTTKRLQFEVQQQELTKDMAEVSLKYQKVLQKKSVAEFQNFMEERVHFNDFQLEISKIKDSSLFNADVSLSVENVSEEDFEITYMIMSKYIGIPKKEYLENESIVRLNPPPYYPNENVIDFIQWNKIGCISSVYENSKYDIRSVKEFINSICSDSNIGNELVSSLRSGESALMNTRFLINTDSDSYVGFVFFIGINGSVSGRNVWKLMLWEPLSQYVFHDESTDFKKVN